MGGATVASLSDRYLHVLELFDEHEEQVAGLQQRALDDLLPELQDDLQLDEQQVARIRSFLDDQITVWRFSRRSRFDDDAAIELLRKTLKWRISASLDLLSAGALDPLYTENPVFFFHPKLVDRLGRPAVVLNLKHVERTPDGSLDAFKEFIALGCEVARRYLSELTRKNPDDDPKLQLVLLVDLAGAGMSNLEIELLPFLLELLKSHFPSMAGALFILNFGWAYGGMWAVAKRVLPQPALDRIMFPSKADLLELFDKDALLKEHGGNLKYRYAFKGSILARLGRPALSASPSASKTNSPHGSRTPSRASSYESLADVYHSSGPSPRSSQPSTPSGGHRTPLLSMTSLASAVEANEKKSDARPLRRNTSSQDFRRHLPSSDPAVASSDSEISGDEAVQRTVEKRRLGGSATSSRNHSRSTSREQSPRRLRSRTNSANASPVMPFRQITGAGGEKENMSRYSSNNPYWGYKPRRDGTRRKRDLFRTLSYLLLLRLLAFRRAIESEIVFIAHYLATKLRAFGVMRPLPAPLSPEIDRSHKRSRSRKAVTFVDLESIEEESIQRRKKRRLPHAARAMSPSARRRANSESRRDSIKLALALVTLILLFRSGAIVRWISGGPIDGRRARIRARLRHMVPFVPSS